MIFIAEESLVPSDRDPPPAGGWYREPSTWELEWSGPNTRLLHLDLREKQTLINFFCAHGDGGSVFLPFLKLTMTNGTTCPESDTPRRRKQITFLFDLCSRVLFLSHPQGTNVRAFGKALVSPLKSSEAKAPVLDVMPMRQHPWNLEMKENILGVGYFFKVSLILSFSKKRVRCVRKLAAYKAAICLQKPLYKLSLLKGEKEF